MWKGKPQIILTALTLLIFLSGCIVIKPTYTKENLVESVTELCKKEYGVEPKVWLIGETVWVYLALTRLITEDIQWDKEMGGKIGNVVLGTNRVLLSMKPRPQFMVVVASDIKERGIDYIIKTWVPDIVKFQLQFISRDEFSRRNVIMIKENADAISDVEGKHIDRQDIRMGDFLAEQVAQRIHTKFTQEQEYKDYFQAQDIGALFNDKTFKIYVNIKQNDVAAKLPTDITKEIINIIVYVLKEYEFNDFTWVEIENSATGEQVTYNRQALKTFLKKGS
jgi:hypothetical protein